jgi:membrane-associated phospholipid phosphatase
MSAIWPGALLVVYLTATGILLLIGRARVPALDLVLHFVLLLAMIVATWLPPVPHWLRLWAPLLVLLFLYSEIPTLIAAAGHESALDSTVVAWERAIFGGQPAIQWAARWRSRAGAELLHGAYLSYYGIIFSVPLGLTLAGRHQDLVEAVLVLMLTFVACFLIYLAFPVAGPRYFWTSPADTVSGPLRATTIWLLEAGSSRGTAFPSSHVAVAATQSVLAVRYFGRIGVLLGILTVALALGAVYGGFHYAVDVLAGAIFGVLVTIVGLTLSKRLRRTTSHANASAPT